MKVLYIGSICGNEHFQEIIQKSKVKPSSAPQHFEAAIIKGLSSNKNVELTCITAECIATYPNGYKFFLEGRVDELVNGIKTEIVPAINLPLLKSYMHSKGIAKKVKYWIKENNDTKDKCVFLYGFYTSVAEAVFHVCKQYGCKCFVMITDVPAMVLTEHKGLKGYLKNRDRVHATLIQGLADGYVYITKQMADVVAPGKPYHVMEVLVDTDILPTDSKPEKKKAIMYAGTLYKKYGIAMIIDIYEKLNTDYELWIMGAGDYEEDIKQKAAQNPKIKYFGVVGREEVLRREQKATLLVNIRNPKDEYTKYSFPSKMIEYMLSGTPVITTKLPGFPQEYDDYLYYCEKYEMEDMFERFQKILNLPSETLAQKGKMASTFVRENKNCVIQMQKMIDFISNHI